MNKYLFESIIDRSRLTLDPDLLYIKEDGEPSLKEDIYYFILEYTDEFVYPVIDLEEFFLKGSSLTYEWKKTSDIDVYLVDENLTDEKLKKIQEKIKKINEKKPRLGSTQHVLEFYIDNKKYNKDNADVIYDLISNKFIKLPSSIRANIKEYWSKFIAVVSPIDLQIGELRRDIIDADELIEYLEESDEKEIRGVLKELREKVNEVKNDLEMLLSQFSNIKELRKLVFSKELTLEEIEKYKSKNLLPDNVVFKLLQKYHYLALLSSLKEAFKSFMEKENEDGSVKVKYFEEFLNEIDKILISFEEKVLHNKRR